MDNIGPQKRPKSLRAVEAEARQAKAMENEWKTFRYDDSKKEEMEAKIKRAHEILKSAPECPKETFEEMKARIESSDFHKELIAGGNYCYFNKNGPIYVHPSVMESLSPSGSIV
jgi:hypothetical protein